MTRLTHLDQENGQAPFHSKENAPSEAEQIIHLKRLLVSLKQHYEKSLQEAQIQFQAEQNQRLALQKELDKAQNQLAEKSRLHEEEHLALRDQHQFLKEMLTKAQEEVNALSHSSFTTLDMSHSDGASEQNLAENPPQPLSTQRRIDLIQENEKLGEELNVAKSRVQKLEIELIENKQHAQTQIEHLHKLLEEQKSVGSEIETVVSTTSSHHLRQELESIKRSILLGSNETKALEIKYIEILNEKINLEHQCKQLQVQLEHQSSNLSSFQEKLHDVDQQKKLLESSLQTKESELIDNGKQKLELQKTIERLNELIKQKERIEDKYEHLKEEWSQLSEKLEEAIEMRIQADLHSNQLEGIAANQESQLQEFSQKLEELLQEKATLELERNQLKSLLEESETRLKVAQQHLAKKVKEAAQLSEKNEEQQVNLTEFAQVIEHQKSQIAQSQASLELYQRHEKRLQDQLHEALKGTENQITKWEEKYFKMYDKLQESENRVRELQKFEEKHHQIQSLLSNLGNFVGNSGNHPAVSSVFQAGKELFDRSAHRFPFADSFQMESEPLNQKPHSESDEETYDLFGMRQPIEKFTQPPSHE